MTRVRIDAFSVSLDGYGAGEGQSAENPLGRGGEDLHAWFDFGVFSGQPVTGADARFTAESMAGLGAWVMGRNMFGPVRGPWPDESWRGWWGENPPYHCPVFVLTHHARPPLEMDGGTVFHFVTDGLDAAMERARRAAGDADIRIGGGVATIRAAFERRLVDRAHLVVAPVVLGRGEALFAGLDLPALGYRVSGAVPGDAAYHIILERS